ncbi:hypothetical protein D3C85_1280290 [compost metagenome]
MLPNISIVPVTPRKHCVGNADVLSMADYRIGVSNGIDNCRKINNAQLVRCGTTDGRCGNGPSEFVDAGAKGSNCGSRSGRVCNQRIDAALNHGPVTSFSICCVCRVSGQLEKDGITNLLIRAGFGNADCRIYRNDNDIRCLFRAAAVL